MRSAAHTHANACTHAHGQVFQEDAVRDLLATMYVAGMDVNSGEFAFKVGFPAKSSLAGVVLAVVPGVLGMVTLEAPADALRDITAMDFLSEFAITFPFGATAAPCSTRTDQFVPAATRFALIACV